jgi:hypothetical protein
LKTFAGSSKDLPVHPKMFFMDLPIPLQWQFGTGLLLNPQNLGISQKILSVCLKIGCVSLKTTELRSPI